jgi:uncharacterized membrane protein YfcA
MPLAIIATLAGVRLIRIINADTFYALIYAFMAIIGLKLTYDGVVNLFA